MSLPSARKLGILYTNPCIDPDQALAENSGRWEQSPFDQTVVMTSSRSSNLPLKSGNSVEVPQGIMSEYVNYSMYAELLEGRSCQSLQFLIPPWLNMEGSVLSITPNNTFTTYIDGNILLNSNILGCQCLCHHASPLALNYQCDKVCSNGSGGGLLWSLPAVLCVALWGITRSEPRCQLSMLYIMYISMIIHFT